MKFALIIVGSIGLVGLAHAQEAGASISAKAQTVRIASDSAIECAVEAGINAFNRLGNTIDLKEVSDALIEKCLTEHDFRSVMMGNIPSSFTYEDAVRTHTEFVADIKKAAFAELITRISK